MADIVFRTDGNSSIGFGHIVRCLSLALQLRKLEIEVTFLLTDSDEKVIELLSSNNIPFVKSKHRAGGTEDIQETRIFTTSNNAKLLLLDRYCFDMPFLTGVRHDDCSYALFADSEQALELKADVIIAPCLPEGDRASTPSTRVLAGPAFAILKEQFLRHSIEPRPYTQLPQKLLVTLGAADNISLYTLILHAVAAIQTPLQATFLTGTRSVDKNSLEQEVLRLGIQVEVIGFTDQIYSFMKWADVAITSGGGTCWELAYVGVPSILLASNESQIPACQYLHNKIGRYIGIGQELNAIKLRNQIESLLCDRVACEHFSKNGQNLVDGKGSIRVAQELVRLLEC